MKNYNVPELTIIELTPEEVVVERDTIALAKMARSEKRRQDKKFKAKNLKKFLRETNHCPSFAEAEAFFRNCKRHPNAKRSTINHLVEE